MGLAKHDIVVLDKVMCCYPQADALIENSLRAAGSTYAFVVPFSSGLRGFTARVGIGLENALRRLRRDPFRAYVHDVDRIERRVAQAGLTRVASARRFIWYVAVHALTQPEGAPARGSVSTTASGEFVGTALQADG